MIITPEGIAVLENDAWISKWVQEEGRLDHDAFWRETVLPMIKQGDVVVESGAYIGDHTIGFIQAVGDNGVVYAFEPNPDAFECLKYNCPEASVRNLALSDVDATASLCYSSNENIGASYLSNTTVSSKTVFTRRLDGFKFNQIDFLIIDTEGHELNILMGARETIYRHQPTIILEMNEGALKRNGYDYKDVISWIEGQRYNHEILQPELKSDAPLYDLICRPK